ncbi:hypothetical protein ACFLUR_00820 [Chloroflexota bacterium]
MSSLKEFGLAIIRIVLGMVVLVAGLFILDIIVYLSATGSTLTEKVMAAYHGSYDKAYAQTYEIGYQEAYEDAYKRGYEKGYEIGLGINSKEEVATRVELRNPTSAELREFLTSDKTDSNPYIKGEYVCFDFSADLNNNAEANGLRAAYVRIRFKEWGHAIVAFETADRGLIFIEPQSDREVELFIGKPYPWQAAGAGRTTDYDDAILNIQIIW